MALIALAPDAILLFIPVNSKLVSSTELVVLPFLIIIPKDDYHTDSDYGLRNSGRSDCPIRTNQGDKPVTDYLDLYRLGGAYFMLPQTCQGVRVVDVTPPCSATIVIIPQIPLVAIVP